MDERFMQDDKDNVNDDALLKFDAIGVTPLSNSSELT
jgi:hypothetical protein